MKTETFKYKDSDEIIKQWNEIQTHFRPLESADPQLESLVLDLLNQWGNITRYIQQEEHEHITLANELYLFATKLCQFTLAYNKLSDKFTTLEPDVIAEICGNFNLLLNTSIPARKLEVMKRFIHYFHPSMNSDFVGMIYNTARLKKYEKYRKYRKYFERKPGEVDVLNFSLRTIFTSLSLIHVDEEESCARNNDKSKEELEPKTLFDYYAEEQYRYDKKNGAPFNFKLIKYFFDKEYCYSEEAFLEYLKPFLHTLCTYVAKHPYENIWYNQQDSVNQLLSRAIELATSDESRKLPVIRRMFLLLVKACEVDQGCGEIHEAIFELAARTPTLKNYTYEKNIESMYRCLQDCLYENNRAFLHYGDPKYYQQSMNLTPEKINDILIDVPYKVANSYLQDMKGSEQLNQNWLKQFLNWIIGIFKQNVFNRNLREAHYRYTPSNDKKFVFCPPAV